ncbi:hypothetical protein [Streptomyces sclerotialus]|uniref:hypothetical protein n=1 Tax=Streptomyces sclerotialus TaxID=1957 RepID=UPI0018CA2AC2
MSEGTHLSMVTARYSDDRLTCWIAPRPVRPRSTDLSLLPAGDQLPGQPDRHGRHPSPQHHPVTTLHGPPRHPAAEPAVLYDRRRDIETVLPRDTAPLRAAGRILRSRPLDADQMLASQANAR